jgi:hypothetical protein
MPRGNVNHNEWFKQFWDTFFSKKELISMTNIENVLNLARYRRMIGE